MYLVGAAGTLDIVLSDSGRLVHGPLDVRCKAKNWNTLPETFPSFALGPVPQCGQYLILSGSEAYTCSLIVMVHQGLFPPPFSAHS